MEMKRAGRRTWWWLIFVVMKHSEHTIWTVDSEYFTCYRLFIICWRIRSSSGRGPTYLPTRCLSKCLSLLSYQTENVPVCLSICLSRLSYQTENGINPNTYSWSYVRWNINPIVAWWTRRPTRQDNRMEFKGRERACTQGSHCLRDDMWKDSAERDRIKLFREIRHVVVFVVCWVLAFFFSVASLVAL